MGPQLSRVQLHAEGHKKHCMSVELHSEEHNYEASLALGRSVNGANVCVFEVRHWGWEYHTDEYKWDERYAFAGSWGGEGGDAELDEPLPGALVLYDLRAQHRSQGELLSHK